MKIEKERCCFGIDDEDEEKQIDENFCQGSMRKGYVYVCIRAKTFKRNDG